MRWVPGLAGLALAIVSCGGCGNGNGGGDSTICLIGDFPADGGPPAGAPTLTLVAGAEDQARTRVVTAWHDGDHVPLVAGGQGGFMIRPALDVTAAAPLPEIAGSTTTCVTVRMIAGAPADAPPILVGVHARRIAGTPATYHVPALFGLLSYARDVDGAPIAVTLDVQSAAGTTARAQVTVVPDATLPPP